MSAWPGDDFEAHGLDTYDHDGTETHTVYGAFARAEALAAGHDNWMNVTEWTTTIKRERRP